MGLYLNSWLCRAHLCRRTARLRYLLVMLRTLPRPDRTPLTLSRHTCNCTLYRRQVKYLLSQRVSAGQAYSSSAPSPAPSPTPSRDSCKRAAPIGVLAETKAALQLGYLSERLGESFLYLSRHINTYFKGPDSAARATPMQATPTPAMPTQALWGKLGYGSVEAGPERRAEKHQSQWPANEVAGSGGRGGAPGEAEVSANHTERTPTAQAAGGFQLFHISSLTTRLGESYSYVARHINSAFSTSGVWGTPSRTLTDDTKPMRKRRRKRRDVRSRVADTSRGSGQAQVMEASGTKQDPVPVKAGDSGGWDDVYLHFARRVNSYFAAKGTDTAPDTLGARFRSVTTATPPSDSQAPPTDSALGLKGPQSAANQEAEALEHRPPGLFHISNLATSFGESYVQMAHHVNRYFKGQGDFDEAEEEEEGCQQADGYASAPPQGRAQNFIRTAISTLLGSYVGGSVGGSTQTASPAGTRWSTQAVSGPRWAEEKTRVLVRKLQQAAGPTSLSACLNELNDHLILYPACTAVAWQEKAASLLLARRRFHGDNQELQGAIRETLALIGYVDSVKGRGIRILSIDGGGTRGVVPLQVLKRLEADTGRQVHQLFDYICGVSTGAVLAFMLGLARLSLEECEETYRRFGSDVFRQNPLVGTVKMGWSHSYYNTSTWEELLRQKLGNAVLIKTARDQLSPKVSAVSAVVNWGTTPKAFVFRNYNHAPGRLSRYAGSSGGQLWQAIRASSAAPGYFQEFPLHSDIHQDGALILNNPCALAVHECRLLWPTRPFQCVLSLGTGRYDNTKRGPVTSTSLRSKISNLICSATDTEGVHTLLEDLLPENVYFRFNPMLSAAVSMDESRLEALDLLRADTELYLDRNQHKVERLSRVLGPERAAIQLAGDWIRERAWQLQQSWA